MFSANDYFFEALIFKRICRFIAGSFASAKENYEIVGLSASEKNSLWKPIFLIHMSFFKYERPMIFIIQMPICLSRVPKNMFWHWNSKKKLGIRILYNVCLGINTFFWAFVFKKLVFIFTKQVGKRYFGIRIKKTQSAVSLLDLLPPPKKTMISLDWVLLKEIKYERQCVFNTKANFF